MRGYYLMHRGWLDHPVFGNRTREPFCRAAAWCWLIEHAAHDPTKVRIGGKVVELQRGQLSHSLRHMADAWGWHHDRCRRFLAELVSEGMLTACNCTVNATAHATAQSIITICNYDKFQIGDSIDATARATARATAARQQTRQHARQHADTETPYNSLNEKADFDPSENQCNINATARATANATIDKEKNLIPPIESSLRSDSLPRKSRKVHQTEFDRFWSTYPRRVGKAAAQRKYLIALRSTDAETLLAAARRYAELMTGKEPQYVAHPATWLHQGRWEDEELQSPAHANGAWRDPGPPGPAPKPEEIWPDLKDTRH